MLSTENLYDVREKYCNFFSSNKLLMKTVIKTFGRENLKEKEKVQMCQNNKYLSHSHMNQMHGFVYLYF